MKKQKKKPSPISEPAVVPSKRETIQTIAMGHSTKDEFAGEYKEQPYMHNPNLIVGNKVIMTNKYDVPNEIKGRIWTVTEAPKYINGKRQVRLEGYNGPYPTDGSLTTS